MEKLNPITKHKEFAGTPGSLAMTFGLPLTVITFALLLNENYRIEGINLKLDKIYKEIPKNWEELVGLAFDKDCWCAYLAWFFLLVAMDWILPGKMLNGVQLRDGSHLTYKINGLSMSLALIGLLLARLAGSERYYLYELDFLYKNLFKLALVAIIFSFLLSIFVYVSSFIPLRNTNKAGNKERILSVNGNTGNAIYDWFIGRELNPRIGSWDIKLFCELRPGMLLWLLINLSCVHHQYHAKGYISDSLILVNALQAFYIFDGVLNEEGLLTMMDITTDGFGFMLSFGDLVWVPFTYCLQARYLSLSPKPVHLGVTKISLILLLSIIGYYIFHSANQQKSDFKSGKLDEQNLKYIRTEFGSKLLCDGWWGMSQHINYFGDWIIAWSWCLPTGFETPLTYFYVVYFAALLVHRQMRDEAKCKVKYGDSWIEYERKVPYKIIPYIY